MKYTPAPSYWGNQESLPVWGEGIEIFHRLSVPTAPGSLPVWGEGIEIFGEYGLCGGGCGLSPYGERGLKSMLLQGFNADLVSPRMGRGD